ISFVQFGEDDVSTHLCAAISSP
ncbi:hypothetical protein CCACVL1_03451, partial [Corchorus capsularis]